MRTLIATVGFPRSGKSSWAKEQNYPIVNPDAIRLALHGYAFVPKAEKFVWAIAETMVRSLFGAGHDTVIIDATNTTKKRRDVWIDKEWTTFFKLISTDVKEYVSRATGDQMPDLIPVIERMAPNFEPLENVNEVEWLG